jgi:hypothetical protein
MGLADIGSAVYRARQQKAAGYAPVPGPASVGGGASVGFTSPTAISQEIGAIDNAVTSLGNDYARDVPLADDGRKAFETWRTSVWQPFRDHNLGLGRLGSGLLFGTDELMAQTQTRRAELEGFAARYKATTSKTPTTPIPADPRTQPQPAPTAPSWWPRWAPQTPSVPWWVWVGGTLALIAGGYGAYRWYRVTRETEARYREEVFRVLPTVLNPQGAAVAQAAAHDVQGCASCQHGVG